MRSIDDVDRWVAERHQPQFIVPKRFRDVSFDSFQIADDRPAHRDVVHQVRDFVLATAPPRRRFWERARTAHGDGLFLVGTPGVGKTHLLAAGFHDAPSSKLFVTFDELVAAAGPLGMQQLTALVTAPSLVCIDEIVLEDPGNFVMLVTLLQHMVEAGTHVLATANMPPQEARDQGGWLRSFERELGMIADVFEIIRIAGRDRRVQPLPASTHDPDQDGPELCVSWEELTDYLTTTHPMHDAGWLQQIDVLSVRGSVDAPNDKDQALRFVRFIDRVYDRGVDLRFVCQSPAPEALVAPLVGDRRYIWHVARGVSRLASMLPKPPDMA